MSACPLCDGDRTAVETGATYTVWLCAKCGLGREEYLQESFDRRRHP
jgi:hypothetical protein